MARALPRVEAEVALAIKIVINLKIALRSLLALAVEVDRLSQRSKKVLMRKILLPRRSILLLSRPMRMETPLSRREVALLRMQM